MQQRRQYVVLALLVAMMVVACYSDSLDDEWKAHKGKHGKNYNAKDELVRKEHFKRVYTHIKEHNAGNYSFSLGLNRYSDWSPEELDKLNGFKPKRAAASQMASKSASLLHALQMSTRQSGTTPASWNWATQPGVGTPVQDQGQCGSCWAFATVGGIEGAYNIKYRNSTTFSVQQLVSCDNSNAGCNGGDPLPALGYVKSQPVGSVTAASYPYSSASYALGSSGTCKTTSLMSGTQLYTYAQMTTGKAGDEALLVDYVYKYGPMPICICVTSKFQSYSGGIFNDPTCKNDYYSLNHCVLLVGYGTSGTTPYWIIKNSYGTSWGEAGYIRIQRNANNMCGVATETYVVQVV